VALAALWLACGRTATFDELVAAAVEQRAPGDAGVVRDAGAPRDAGRVEPGLADDLIYLHDPTNLFTYAPATNALRRVGQFDCGRSVNDLAIDRAGRGFVVTTTDLHRVNLETGRCTRIGVLPDLVVALAFLPAGALGTEEALVGYGNSAYYQFNLVTGSATRLGTSDLAGNLVPSGDLAALDDGGTYLTVKDTPTAKDCTDCLVRIDPRNGSVLENLGPLGLEGVWGLASFGDELFGFTTLGQAVKVVALPGGVKTTPLPLDAGQVIRFWGAAARPGARQRLDGGRE
jgi:hypothetical protein